VSRSWKWVWLAVAWTMIMVMLTMMTSLGGATEVESESSYFERHETCLRNGPSSIRNAKLIADEKQWLVCGRQIVIGLDLATRTVEAREAESVMTDLDFLLPIEAGNIDALRMRGMDIACSRIHSGEQLIMRSSLQARARPAGREGSI